MAKKPTLHPHSDRQAFERLMVLLATLVRHPGVGSSDRNLEDMPCCQALEQVQRQLTEVAMKLGIVFPPGYPSIPTLRKDVETLRKYGILDDRRYSWGYYLGTGAMEVRELQFAFQALASQAEYQADPEARKVYRRLSKRLKGLDMDLKGELFYPVRQQLNQAIHHTDPEEMRAQQKYRDTLFNQLAAVEQAILAGRGIEIFRTADRYGMGQEGFVQVYPLQLVYHNISWYLVHEECDTGHFGISRVDRFSSHCKLLPEFERSLTEQRSHLETAHRLRQDGWGLFLGDREEQRQELAGELQFLKMKVRFFFPIAPFIVEGDRRHPRQRLKLGKDAEGKLTHVDYSVSLPGRSLREFKTWVNQYMDSALVLSPPELVEEHRQGAERLVERYRQL